MRTDQPDGAGNWPLETNEFLERSNSTEREAIRISYFAAAWARHIPLGYTIFSKKNQASLTPQHQLLGLPACTISLVGGTTPLCGTMTDSLAQQKHSTANILRAVLRQLVETGEISDHIRQASREGKDSASEVYHFPTLWEHQRLLLPQYSKPLSISIH